MKVVVTGSAGHLGEALVRTLERAGHRPCGLDVLAGPTTARVGSILDRSVVRDCLTGADAVIHAATLHKPHVATHPNQQFVDTNITGTLTLLEEAVAAKLRAFIFTSTTSTFGRALSPVPGQPAAWITEDVVPLPKNIYGVTKVAAESLCELFHRRHGLPVVVLKTSRFFPEPDDDPEMRKLYTDDNSKANEFLFRRVDLEDVVSAHLLALDQAAAIGFNRYIVSATSPFAASDCSALHTDAPAVIRRYAPDFEAVYARAGFRMFPRIDRVYVNQRARRDLGWTPRYDFTHVLACLQEERPIQSELARAVGRKGYHRSATKIQGV